MNWDRSRSHQSKGADNGVFTCSSERGKNLAEIIKANEMSEMSENGGQKKTVLVHLFCCPEPRSSDTV